MSRRRTGPVLLAIMACALVAASGASSASALTLKGGYSVFDNCPITNPEVHGCLYSTTESGEIKIGKQTVPIINKQYLQGGFRIRETGTSFFAATNGETLSKTPQKVGGGLLGLINCQEIKGFGILEIIERGACELVFENGTTGVNATTELAAPASSIGLNEENLFAESGTALSLPIKVKLENPFLGKECYIGSTAHPITLKLTTGTTSPPLPNKAIKGKKGTLTSKEEGGILVVSGSSLVDNSFAAPEATGCGELFSFLIDPIIDGKIGLPSAAGNNTAILNNKIEQASVEVIEEYGE
jgi:hypothetical protein